MASAIRIVNGKVYDPSNNIDGVVKDICILDGKIVDKVPADSTTLDARGMVVMPGGVDIHCHIAGHKVNLARKLMPEDHRRDVAPRDKARRSGTGGIVPSTFTTGYRYATLGYTTAMEAAVPPMGARHTLEEFHDTPVIDKGFYVLLANNVCLNQLLEQKRMEEFRQAVAWWLNASKAYAIKMVNPGGDEPWKGRKNSNVTNLDEKISGFELTPRQIIKALIDASNDLGLPHPAHIHCNNLGHSGNYLTTLDTMKTAEGRRVHITHIQFHSYGGERGKNPISKAPEIAAFINDNPNVSADVGQVMFGTAALMTGDAPLTWLLRNMTKSKWINADTECESGCGILPFSYQEHIYTHALQWAMGLELFLLSKDPWRMVLSTDHPNGGSFMNYPKLIKLLMDKAYRDETARAVNQKAIAKTTLLDIEREMTLQEIAIITRAGPAKLLGLKHKGHLGVGADADITIYDELDDREAMFNAARYVMKGGQLIIDNHEFSSDCEGRILHVSPEYDAGIEEKLRPFFEDYYSIQFDNYPVHPRYLHDDVRVPNLA
ncbi:MAG TPA: formylmethanofuran dehydrogenase subunit A [Methylococcaceae bacterium]|nr:formylmethanofuran dehydrogenase subunit A [Methylococcaceae bacterium]